MKNHDGQLPSIFIIHNSGFVSRFRINSAALNGARHLNRVPSRHSLILHLGATCAGKRKNLSPCKKMFISRRADTSFDGNLFFPRGVLYRRPFGAKKKKKEFADIEFYKGWILNGSPRLSCFTNVDGQNAWRVDSNLFILSVNIRYSKKKCSEIYLCRKSLGRRVHFDVSHNFFFH